MTRIKHWRMLAMIAIAAFTALAVSAPIASAEGGSIIGGRVCPQATSSTAGVGLCRVAGYSTADINYVGWTYLNLNYCAPGMACIQVYRTSMNAWRWNGSAWVSGQLPGGWTYVQPGGGGWRFAYSNSAKAWFAVTTGRFEIRG